MDIPDEIFVHVIASGNAEPHVIANVITAGVDDQPEVKLFLLLGNELAITDLADALDLGAKHSTILAAYETELWRQREDNARLRTMVEQVEALAETMDPTFKRSHPPVS